MARVSKTWEPKGLEITKGIEVSVDNLADYIIHMKEKDINYDFIMTIFGEFNGKTLCRPYDLLIVPENSFSFKDYDNKVKSNTSKFTTTIGIYLMNLILSDIGLSKLFNGYLNKNLNKKEFGKIESALAFALIEDDITTEQLKRWENYTQWMMPFEDILSHSHTEKMLSCTKILNKKKAELLKQYEKEIAAGDIVVAEKIEKELLSFAKEYLGDDECMDTIDSGAGGQFGNNFKNMFVMKGAIRNPDPAAKQKYDIVTSNYLDGVSAEEYPLIAGAGAEGAYSRGKKTENGGYIEKLMISAFQHIKIDEKGSDCGTKKYIVVDLNEDNYKDYMYSYIIENNGSLTLLTSKNYTKYLGKKVKFRFSSMCKGTKVGICNMCAGELLYNSVENIGPAMSQIPDVLKIACMKSFHDSRISTTKIDPMRVFYPF